MECTNCNSLFQMIKVMNDNINSILSGYEILLNVVNNHDNEIIQMKTATTDKTEISCKKVSSNTIDKWGDIIVSPGKIPVANNVDILDSLSNVDTEEDNNMIYLPIPSRDKIFPSSSSPKPLNAPLAIDFEKFSDISDVSRNSIINNDSSSCISSLNHETYNMSSCSSSRTDNDEYSSCSDISHCSKSDHNCDASYYRSESNKDLIPSCNLSYLPYEIHDQQLFDLFEVTKLEDSTSFTHFFNNRSAVYYGIHPYQYGKTAHTARDFSQNPYLLKILNYVEIVYPTFAFNSAMIHRYNTGEDFIPHHSDDEDDIEDNSLILTLSFGATRTVEFKEIGEGKCKENLRVHHGDSFIMSKKSQSYFTHGILKEKSSDKRLSITLRLIKPRKNVDINQLDIGTQTNDKEYVISQEACTPVNDGYQPTAPQNNVPEEDSTVIRFQRELESLPSQPDIHSHDGYQPISSDSEESNNAVYGRNHKFRPFQTRELTKKTVDTLYISSSMFRHLDPKRLSSSKQRAEVLFYPGADASGMAWRITHDPKFLALDKSSVKKVFIMVGTNNTDNLFTGSCSFNKAKEDINEILYKLWSFFSDAQMYVINILPRQNASKNLIVQDLNEYTKQVCKAHGLNFINTQAIGNNGFLNVDGTRKQSLFMHGYDNVHLNNMGYRVMANFLKHIAHWN